MPENNENTFRKHDLRWCNELKFYTNGGFACVQFPPSKNAEFLFKLCLVTQNMIKFVLLFTCNVTNSLMLRYFEFSLIPRE